MSEEVRKEGWMSKKGALVRAWRMRWFTLIGQRLVYSKKPGIKPQGIIELNEMKSVDKATETSRPNVFKIEMSTGRTFMIQAESEDDMNEWILEIQRTMGIGTTIGAIDDIVILQVLQFANNISTFVAKLKGENLCLVDRYPLNYFGDTQKRFDVSSPFICNFRFSVTQDDALLGVTEYVRAHPLRDFLQSRGRFPDRTVQIYAGEILLALSAMHEKGFVYGCLDLDTIMLRDNGHIMLRIFPSTPNAFNSANRSYLSPEVLAHETPTVNSDYWSLGVIIYTLISGFVPFFRYTEESMEEAVRSHKLEMQQDVSDSAADLIMILLRQKDVTIDIDTIKQHQFFRGLDWSSIESVDMSAVDRFWKPKFESTPPAITEDVLSETPLFSLGDLVQWKTF